MLNDKQSEHSFRPTIKGVARLSAARAHHKSAAFPPLKFAYKNVTWKKIMFRAY